MITNRENYAKLQVKRDSLAAEAKIIRRKERSFRKWIIKSGAFGANYLADMQAKGWEIKHVAPKGRPGMSAEERAEYKAGKWAHIARIRKLNPRYDESARYSLWLHRTDDVRNEARATNLAIAYMKGVPYSVVETPSKNPNKAFQRRPDAKKIWKLVTRYPLRNDESTEDMKYLEDWLKGSNLTNSD